MANTSLNPQNSQVHELVKQFVPAEVNYTLTKVQSLWSGYGEITRCELSKGLAVPAPLSSLEHDVSFIIKIISLAAFEQNETPKHPRAWQSDFAHQRKLSSYRNECRFYSHYSQHTHSQCAVPKLMAAHFDDAQISIVMEDLDAKGFCLRHTQANTEIAATGIKWLAHFHARFMQADLDQTWAIGTYWHLATRPQEHESMPESQLKDAAKAIDEKLNSAQFTTLLHGDAKLANFCFSSDSTRTAAVDFQYTGRGVGVKDLIYFLGSCFNEHELTEHAEPLVDLYFATLKASLVALAEEDAIQVINGAGAASFSNIEQEWRGLIPFAWADFERFLAGWAPEHKKRHAYSHQQTKGALKAL